MKLANNNPSFAFEVKQQINKLMNPLNFRIKDRLSLKPVPDANILMVDEGCTYQQLANWDDVTDAVFVKNEYFKTFSNLNKAALYLHEAIYKVARVRASAKNSDEVRRLVAEILSTTEKLSTTFEQKRDIQVNPLIGPVPGGIKHTYSNEYFEELIVNLGALTRENLKDAIGEVTITVKEVKELKQTWQSKKKEYENAVATGVSKSQLKKMKKDLDASEDVFTSYVATFCSGDQPNCPWFAYTEIRGPLLPKDDLFLELGVIGMESRDLTIEVKVKLHDADETTLVETFKINAPQISKWPEDKVKKKIVFKVYQNFQE